MDIIDLIASLISGAIGGNMVGGALNDQSLGSSRDSLLGVLGGGIAGVILQSLGATGSGSDVLDAASTKTAHAA